MKSFIKIIVEGADRELPLTDLPPVRDRHAETLGTLLMSDPGVGLYDLPYRC